MHYSRKALLWHKYTMLPFYDQHFLLLVFIIEMRTHDFAEMHDCGMNTFILPFCDQHLLQVFIIVMRTHDFAEMHDCGMSTLVLPFYDQHFLLLVFIIEMRTHDFAEMHDCGIYVTILWSTLLTSSVYHCNENPWFCRNAWLWQEYTYITILWMRPTDCFIAEW